MRLFVEAAGRIVLYLVLVAMIAVGGSANVVTRFCAAAIWLVLLLLLIFGKGPRSAAATTFAFFAVLLLGGWTYLQTSDAAWTWLQAQGGMFPLSVGISRSTLSLAPADTIQTLVTALVPFSAFVAASFAFRYEPDVTRLITVMAVLGVLTAIYGILVYATGNHIYFVTVKRFYLDDLTAAFVNRNTAANFFGIVLACLTALIFANWSSIRSLVDIKDSEATGGWLKALFLLGGWVATFLALMLTSSRAGSATALIAVFIIVALCLTGRNSRSSREQWSRSTRLLTIAGIALLMLVLIFFLSGQVMHRIQADWTYDPRFCIMPGLIRLWSDNWLFGTGLGTFPLAFPPYKDASCGLAEQWLQAHNFYIEGAITVGALFPVMAVLTIVTLGVIFLRGLRHRRRYRWVPALGLGLLTQQVIHNVIDFPIQNVAIAFIFAVLMAVCVSIALARTSTDPTGLRSAA